MPTGAGYLSLGGIGLESLAAWGGLVAPTKLIPVVSESLVGKVNWIEKNWLVGGTGKTYPETDTQIAGGAFRVRASYRTSEYLIFAAMAGTDTKSGTETPYSHKIELGADVTRAMSIILDKTITCDNMAGAKVKSMSLVANNEGVFWDFDVVGKVLTRATTHQAALQALSYDESNPLVKLQHLVFRIADCVDALAAGDVVNASDVNLTLNNPLADSDFTSSSGAYILEPIRTNRRGVTLGFTLPRFQADTMYAAMLAGTKLQADMIFTGGALGGGNFKMTINIPTLYVKSCTTPISNEEKIPVNVECECYRNNSNANMSQTEEFELILQNSNASALSWTA